MSRRRGPTDFSAQDRFADAFRHALERRGMSLVTLQERLSSHGNPVSVTALSYWRSGARNPEGAVSLAAVADIERVLGLEEGSLLRRLGPNRRIGAVDTVRMVGEERVTRAIDECAAGLVSPDQADFRDLSTHIIADVDETGDLRSLRNQAVLQCVSGTLLEIPFFELAGAPTDLAPVFTAISACRVERTARHPGGEVFGVVMRLDAPVEPAGSAVIEWRMDFPPGYPPARLLEHAVFRRSRELLLMVRFPPKALPAWCEEFEDDPDGHPVLARLLDIGPTVHVTRGGFGPGRVGIAWGYES